MIRTKLHTPAKLKRRGRTPAACAASRRICTTRLYATIDKANSFDADRPGRSGQCPEPGFGQSQHHVVTAADRRVGHGEHAEVAIGQEDRPLGQAGQQPRCQVHFALRRGAVHGPHGRADGAAAGQFVATTR